MSVSKHMRSSPCASHVSCGQRGMALVVSLVILAVLTLLGVGAMQMAGIEEHMSGNVSDLNVAFQAAESALRDGELDVLKNIGPATPFDLACTNGLCDVNDTSTPPWETINWSSAGDTRSYGQYTGATPMDNVSQQPRYIIEKLPTLAAGVGQSVAVGIKPSGTGEAYRITALGYGGRSESQVMLQSIFVKR